MKLRYLLLLLTAAALLPVLSGCGSSSEEATAQTTMPLKKYVAKADLICSNASFEQGDKAGIYLAKHPNARKVDLVVPAAVPPLEKMFSELHELGLPKGHEKEAEIFLEEAEKALERLKKEPSGALSEHHSPFEKANQLGEKLGMGDCSRNP